MNNGDGQNQRQMLRIVWGSGDKSFYDLDWLSRFSTSHHNVVDGTTKNKAEHPTSGRVTKDVAIGARENPCCVPIPKFDYNQVMTNKNNNDNDAN